MEQQEQEKFLSLPFLVYHLNPTQHTPAAFYKQQMVLAFLPSEQGIIYPISAAALAPSTGLPQSSHLKLPRPDCTNTRNWGNTVYLLLSIKPTACNTSVKIKASSGKPDGGDVECSPSVAASDRPRLF